MLVRALGIAASCLAASCLWLTSAPAVTDGRVITERDSGKTFTLRRGHELTLRLSERYTWGDPRVLGRSVRLMPVLYFSDPGFREWTIATRLRGTARISAIGRDPICGGCAPQRFRISVVVR